jgi:hypothetical protein
MSFTSVVTSLTNLLSASGVSAGMIPSTVSSILGSSTASQALPYLNTIVANATEQAVINQEIIKIEEIPGLPANVMGLLSMLMIPGNDPLKVQQICQGIQQTLASASTIVL